VFTAPYAVLLDAVSFAASALAIFRIRAIEETPATVERSDGKKSSMWTELKEGLRFVLSNPNLRAQAGCTSTSNFFSSVSFSIILVYAVRELDLSPGLIGFVFSLGALGGLLGALTATRISGRFGIGPTTIVMAAFFGPTMILYAIAPSGHAAVPLLVTAQLIFGFTVVVYNIVQVSYRQAICPPRLQGRMNSVMRFIVWGTIPLGTLAGGALASWIGLRETIVVGALGGGLAVFWIVFSPQRHLRDMPEPVDDDVVAEAGLEEAVPSLSA
jgi:MFS family permease